MTQDGIHYDIPESVYRADPAYSYSRVKLAAGTMAEYRYAMEHPKPVTDAMVTGTLIDQLVTDGRFTNIEIKPSPRAPNGWRESVIASGRTPVTEEMVAIANGARASLMAHSVASRFISASRKQVSMFLTHDGIRLKARIDFVPSGSASLVDLKKCQDASPGLFVTRQDGTEYFQHPKWSYDIRDFGYDMQAGLYLWMWNKLAGTEDRRDDWLHICVEEKAPHLVNVFQMEREAIREGEEKFFRLLGRIRECEASGKWPGYEEKIHVTGVAR
jgi:hypothetical protein